MRKLWYVISFLSLFMVSCTFEATLTKQSSTSTGSGSGSGSGSSGPEAPRSLTLSGIQPSSAVSYISHEDVQVTIENPDPNYPASSLNWSLPSNVSSLSTTCTSSLTVSSSCTATFRITSDGQASQIYNLAINYTQNGEIKSSTFSVTMNGSFPGDVTVEKVYPNYGSNWNDYIMNSDLTKKGGKPCLSFY